MGWALAVAMLPCAAGRFVPGLGHPVHKTADPRTAVIIAIANREGLRAHSPPDCVPTCACSRPLVASTPGCLAARSRSTALEWQVPRLLISDCHLSCCVAWPCSHARRGYSVTLLKSCVTPSHPTSTQRSTGMPCIGQAPTMKSHNNASPAHPSPATCTGRVRRGKSWQIWSLTYPDIGHHHMTRACERVNLRAVLQICNKEKIA